MKTKKLHLPFLSFLFLLALTAFCSRQPEPSSSKTSTPEIGTKTAALSSKSDGILMRKDETFTVNTYAALRDNARKGDTFVTIDLVDTRKLFADRDNAKGDVLMVYGAQGADIITENTSLSGTVVDSHSAGAYELFTVSRVEGTKIYLEAECKGLKNDYTVHGRAQVIRVPQYSSVNLVNSTIIAKPWDSKTGTGGVAAMIVAGELKLDKTSSISATGMGFKGGASYDQSGTFAPSSNYVGLDAGGQKGEGIAGPMDDFTPALRYGRGASATGGGGGCGIDAGGGGGANMTVSPLNHTGQGKKPALTSHALEENAAWDVDPNSIANGPNGSKNFMDSSGGGRGGYSWAVPGLSPAFPDPDPANRQLPTPSTFGPGHLAWNGYSYSNQTQQWSQVTGDFRREVGGLGGHPQKFAENRFYFGGGGGAGDHTGGNNSMMPVGQGGDGGGMVYILAGSILGESGSTIQSNGTLGGSQSTLLRVRSGGGGGGAGGSIYIRASGLLKNVSISARGGEGGWQLIKSALDTSHSFGPGGGGSGGIIYILGAPDEETVRMNVDTGNPGQTGQDYLVFRETETEKFQPGYPSFPENGATKGEDGIIQKISFKDLDFSVSQPPIQCIGTKFEGPILAQFVGSGCSVASGQPHAPFDMIVILAIVSCGVLFSSLRRTHRMQ